MLLENRSGELIGAWPIDGALISTVGRSSDIFIMSVGFSRSLSQSFCLESNSPSVCPSKTTNRDGLIIFYSYRKLRTKPGVSLWFAGQYRSGRLPHLSQH